jgi:CheY-like chemotaxis protein
MRATSTETAPPARILLVDDNRLGLVARKSVLEEQGYQITTANQGEEGLQRFLGGSFDLVITDYKMPKMNGLELIERIRERSSGVPIILISGYVDGLGMTEDSTGADVVIPKNAHEVPHLVRSVNRLLGRTPKKPAGSHRPLAKAKRQGAR